MQLTVIGKQIDVGDALRTHVGDSLETISAKYFENAIDANVVLSRQAHLYRADIALHPSRNVLMQSNAEAADPYVAFDLAADRMAKRLRRYKRRLRDYNKGRDQAGEASQTAQAYVLDAGSDGAGDGDGEAEVGDQPLVVAEMTTEIESLTVSDAVMRLDLGGLPALLFRNSAHGGLNMVYRRQDGNVGWVDPQGTQQTVA